MRGLRAATITMMALSSVRAHVSRAPLSTFRAVSSTRRFFSSALLTSANFEGASDRTTRRHHLSTETAVLSATGLKEVLDKSTLLQDLSTLAEYTGTIDANELKEPLQHIMGKLHRNERLPKEFILKLLDHSIGYHKQLPNILEINRSQAPNSTAETPQYTSNITVVGDVHGQYADFAYIFENQDIGDYPSASNQFIFNGDLVDRGDKGLEIVIALLFAKALCPSSVHILRGNHETAGMYEAYGFAQEVLRKYDLDVLDRFRAFFDTLPIAAVVEKAIFVVHGGLGPKNVNMTLVDINALDRIGEPDYDSPLSELLWSDPRDGFHGFRLNRGRGGGHCFGPDVTETFLARNGLQLLIRSHEVCMQGLQVLHNGLCATVFSAPNYCGNTGNLAAVVRFDKPDSMAATVQQYGPATYERARREQLKKEEGAQEQ